MSMKYERSGEPTEEQPSISRTFRHVYRFILRAMQGDTTIATALFQRYLAGELPEDLLALSRRCVQEDQRPANSAVRLPEGSLMPAAQSVRGLRRCTQGASDEKLTTKQLEVR